MHTAQSMCIIVEWGWRMKIDEIHFIIGVTIHMVSTGKKNTNSLDNVCSILCPLWGCTDSPASCGWYVHWPGKVNNSLLRYIHKPYFCVHSHNQWYLCTCLIQLTLMHLMAFIFNIISNLKVIDSLLLILPECGVQYIWRNRMPWCPYCGCKSRDGRIRRWKPLCHPGCRTLHSSKDIPWFCIQKDKSKKQGENLF